MDSKIIPLQNIDEFKTSILIEERVAILIFTAEWFYFKIIFKVSTKS